jgi:hypothetical protein
MAKIGKYKIPEFDWKQTLKDIDYGQMLGSSFNAFDSLNSAFTASDNLQFKADILDAQSESILENAMRRSKSIREAGEQFQGKQIAATAASGVVIGTGSSLELLAESYKATSQRIADDVRSGTLQRQSNMDRSAHLRKTAKKTEQAGYIKAAGSILGGFYS